MAYATLQNLRDFGISSAVANDADATDALTLASDIVDDYTDASFGPSGVATKTLVGRPGVDLVLPRPFSAITAVQVGQVDLPASAYSVTDIGLSFSGGAYRDGDGYLIPWPIYDYSQPVPIVVTGTFGYGSTPIAVKRATLLIAADVCRPSQNSDPTVKSLSVEGYSLVYRDDLQAMDTTGNQDADRLLRRFNQSIYVL